MRRPSEATVSTKLGKVLSKKVTQVHLERITLATMLRTKEPVRKLLQQSRQAIWMPRIQKAALMMVRSARLLDIF